MLKKIKQFSDNYFIIAAGVFAIVLSPLIDGLGSDDKMYYWWFSGGLFILFIFGIYDEIKKSKKLSSDTIHIPMVIKVDDGPDLKYVMKNLLEKIEEKFGFNEYDDLLLKYHSINLDDLLFEYNGSIYEFDRLMNFARIIKYNVTKIEKQLKGKVKFHVAYYRRPSVGFLLGTIFRTEGIVIYQNSDFDNRFYDVINVDSRKYKSFINNFKKYDIIESINNTNDSTVLIAINSSSHPIAINTSSLNKYQNIITVNLIEGSTIPYESDWTIYAQELYTVIRDAQIKYKKTVIAHAMPEALSIILGMAIENYWDVEITQYENQDYKYIYTMNKINYYSY